ncbi:MAG: multidrug efflux RND transporter permease subunit [Planctomycetes bacterium]|nr:multidrug efflux RND transporter permease subunit [Planctomycetota bacterium]
MGFSQFFIRRPVFAGVLSVLILILGALSLARLPVSEYPEIVPPSVVVRAAYPGANARTIAETVATPLEQTINGVENMLYMTSQAASDGVMALTITFQLGTDIDKAQVQVQNRVSQALPKLPEDVRRLGVVVTKQSPDLTMVAHLVSPNGRYDEIYLRNFATLQVKDALARIPGVGSVEVFGAGDFAMRVWLDTDKLASRGLTASDVVGAIREQNTQVAAGAIGQPPMGRAAGIPGAEFETQITTQGRLVDEEQFGEIIVKVGPQGQKTFLKDVARVELGASSYSLRSLLDNQVAIALPIFQAPGANAIQLSNDVRALLAKMQADFPDGVEYRIVYDPTVFVRKSISAVITTLLEAIALVVIVVIVFLQTWRASIIPLVAVPVSLVGTFAAMKMLGFSINALSLFGLVLAIGIVVDDAIVVVENVERNIARGLSPLDATRVAMKEVTGPIIATALVLCAVFVPTGFISGLTGQFYKQFAITIAISTVISAFNSLTLSPALSAVLLRGHGQEKDVLQKVIDALLGWFFRPFNRFFAWASERYSKSVGWAIRKSVIAIGLYLGLVYLTGWSFANTPTGFVPTQDKQYLVAFAQLPDAASIDRTESVIRRMTDMALKTPGVEHAVAFPGLSVNGFAASPNAGIVFIGLKPFEERETPDLSGLAIVGALNAQFSQIQEAFVLAVPPPPVNGLGTLGGFKLYVQDKGDLGYDALYQNTQALVGRAWQTPVLANTFSTFTVNVPQLQADIDREKAKSQGVPLQALFETMQINLGSLYVNDFNRFGRTYQVVVQADQTYRDEAGDVTRLKVRNDRGEMVPLGTLVEVREGYGPDRVIRYNGSPAAEITGGPAPGHSSGEAEALIASYAEEGLPKGMSFEWTELTYQRILAGNTAVYVYPLCLLLVFLVLAAQYESFRMPLAIVLIVPLCLLFALAGVYLSQGDNNVFTQIGLIVLVGLACKNAILIVEFAKVKQDEGLSAADAAIAAAKLRLRPILMTSIAFIAGVFPLVVSTGAGAEMRRAMGVAVFSGMIGVTFLGLILTPVFYAFLLRWGARRAPHVESAPGTTHGGTHLGATTAGVLSLTLFLGGCVGTPVGPDYERPKLDVPARFAGVDAGAWQEGRPADGAARGEWWRIFADPELDSLQRRAAEENQELRAALARLAEARAGAAEARSTLFPSASLDPSWSRTRNSPNGAIPIPIRHSESTRVPIDVSYELDLFGKNQRLIEAAERSAEARVAAFETVRLALHAEVARLYFTLRARDADLSLLRRTATLREEAVAIARARFDGGVGNELDRTRAEVEAATVRAELAAAERARSAVVNSLALLVGAPAGAFEFAAQPPLEGAPPEVPAGLPGELLERRPDVAAAERDLAARNARIGVARAAFFPSIRLTGYGGLESNELGDLFDWDSRIWSLGPSITLPIFQGGRLEANLEKSRAAWEEGVALYRQQVLVAFREVQDALAATRWLREEARADAEALVAARDAARIARQRHDAGLTTYLDVIESERTALAIERAATQLTGARYGTAVTLIQALGGGWTSSELEPLAKSQPTESRAR